MQRGVLAGDPWICRDHIALGHAVTTSGSDCRYIYGDSIFRLSWIPFGLSKARTRALVFRHAIGKAPIIRSSSASLKPPPAGGFSRKDSSKMACKYLERPS